MEFLNKDYYDQKTKTFPGKHWDSASSRWEYHCMAVEWVKGLNLSDASQILEIGTMGVGLVHGSTRMDYDASINNSDWEIEDEHLEIVHDCRKTPWPFADNEFKLVIALRVLHHLTPFQKEAFAEMRRISNNILLVVPEQDIHPRGVDYTTLVEWADGIMPYKYYRFDRNKGSMFFW